MTSDLLTGKDGEAKRMGEGDGFMLLASTLFGFGGDYFPLIHRLSLTRR